MARKKRNLFASVQRAINTLREKHESRPAPVQTARVEAARRVATLAAKANVDKIEKAKTNSGLREGVGSTVSDAIKRVSSQQQTAANVARRMATLRSQAAKDQTRYAQALQNKRRDTSIKAQGRGMLMQSQYASAPSVRLGTESARRLEAGSPTNSIVIEGWKSKFNPATKEQVKARQKYGYDKAFDKTIQKAVKDADKRATYTDTSKGNKKATMAQGRGVTAGAHQVADAIKQEKGNIAFGFKEGWSPEEVEKIYRKQFGKEVDEKTKKKLEKARKSGGYMAGIGGAQLSQYLATAPIANQFAAARLAKAGISSKRVQGAMKGVDTINKAKKVRRVNIAADQAASLPMNIIDAMKEDNLGDMVKRFGINQTLDLAFGNLAEIPGFRKNVNVIKAKALQNAGDPEGAVKALGRVKKSDLAEWRRALDDKAAKTEDKGVSETWKSIQDEEVEQAMKNAEAPGQLRIRDAEVQKEVGYRPENAATQRKKEQFRTIQDSNPMTDDVHTGIRSADEIRTFREAIEDGDGFTPDFTEADAQKAIDNGKITVYSSTEIGDGAFVTPSKMQAQDYAGGGKVYEKEVDLDDVAWIDGGEGQYAPKDAQMKEKPTAAPETTNVESGLAEGSSDSNIPNTGEAANTRPEMTLDRAVELNRRAREGGEKYGYYEGGTPRANDEGVSITKGVDSAQNSDLISDAAKETNWEDAIEGKLPKVSKTIQGAKEEAAARWDADQQSALDRLVKSTEGLKEGQVPSGYDTLQDFFADAEQGIKYYKAMQEEAVAAKNFREAEAWTNREADILGRAQLVASNMGSGMRQYQELLKGTEAGREALFRREMGRLEKECAKMLKGKELRISDEAMEKIRKAKDPLEQAKAWKEASVELWNQIPASFMEKQNALRKTAMLLNPKTHIRNIIGNFFFGPIRKIKNVIATGGEALAQKAGLIDEADRQKGLLTKPGTKEKKEYADTVFDKYKDIIKGESKNVDKVASNRPMEADLFSAGEQNAFRKGLNKGLDKISHFSGRTLEREDVAAMRPSFRNAMARIMNGRNLSVDDLVNNTALRDSVIEDATEEALRATYRDNSALSRLIAKGKNPGSDASTIRKAAALILDTIMPFSKTPINILRRSLDYSPFGFVEGAYHFARGIKRGDKKAITTAIDRAASGMTGSGLMLLGYALAQQGNLRGELNKDDYGYYQKDLGRQNFSFIWNDENGKEKSFTLDWFVPNSIPLFMGVSLHEYGEENGLSIYEMADVIDQVFDPTMELSVMQGIKNTLETHKEEGLKGVALNTGLNYLGQYRPTLLGQVARTIDDTRRDTSSNAESRTERTLEKWKNKNMANIPGLSKKLPAYQDVWGREQKNGNALENFLSPGYYKEYTGDSVDKEIERLYKSTQNEKIIPEKYWKSSVDFNGGKVSLDGKDLEGWRRFQGSKAKEDLKTLFRSSNYRNASDTDKAKMIQKVYTQAEDEARIDTLLKKGKDEWKVYGEGKTFGTSKRKPDYESAKAAGIDAKTYYDLMSTKDWDNDGNGRAKSSEVIDYLNGRDDLTGEQKAEIFARIAPWNAKNPYGKGIDKASAKSSSSGGGRRGRGGRRRYGGGSSKAKTAKPREKTASEKAFANEHSAADLRSNIKAVNLLKNTRGLSNTQKKALLKILLKRLEV